MSVPGIAVGITAPSSVISPIEFEAGLEGLKEQGFRPLVHPDAKKKAFLYAGSDQVRAQAFYDWAKNPNFDVIWCARGGYGASKLVPILDELTRLQGIPSQKLLIGYSDATVLMEYVRTRWAWSTLHAPMPALKEFLELKPAHWRGISSLVRRPAETQVPYAPWGTKRFHLIHSTRTEIVGNLVGGNLATWTSLIGTELENRTPGRILFFEEITESIARIDRMVQQLSQSGGFEGVSALVLGTFTECKDSVSQGVASRAGLKSKAPKKVGLRKEVNLKSALKEIFGSIGERYKIPVVSGLPVGHGGGYHSLALGATYRLSPQGSLEMISWGWPGAKQS